MGPFIVDFLYAAARLVVAVDGGHHDDPSVAARDAARGALLRAQASRSCASPTNRSSTTPSAHSTGTVHCSERLADAATSASALGFPTANDESPRHRPPPRGDIR
ncbi:MAG: DUF559 domain-containing protein [Myxococcales bacterium]|nr:DUF559 domain-containing protein [Myxococcales bacterium]